MDFSRETQTLVGTARSGVEQTEAVLDTIQRQVAALIGADAQGITARVGHQDPLSIGRDYGSAENEGVIAVYLDPERRTRTSAEWIVVVKESLRVPYDAEVVYEAAVDGPPGLEPINVFVLANDPGVRRQVTRESQSTYYLNGARCRRRGWPGSHGRCGAGRG